MMYISYHARKGKAIEKLHFFADFFENRISAFPNTYEPKIYAYALIGVLCCLRIPDTRYHLCREFLDSIIAFRSTTVYYFVKCSLFYYLQATFQIPFLYHYPRTELLSNPEPLIFLTFLSRSMFSLICFIQYCGFLPRSNRVFSRSHSFPWKNSLSQKTAILCLIIAMPGEPGSFL